MSSQPTSYDTENVTVSLSRLALAKAIKTPDDDEEGGEFTNREPWTKSIIFHQSHVSNSMRQSMLFPNQPRQRQPGSGQQQRRSHSQMLLQQQQQRPHSQYPQQRRRSQSSSHMLDQYQEQGQHHSQQQQRQSRATSPSPQQLLDNNNNNTRPRSSYEMYNMQTSSSDRSGSQGSSSQQQQQQQQQRTIYSQQQGRQSKMIVNSDIEDDDDEEDVSSESDDDDDDQSQTTPMPRKSASFQILNNQAAAASSSSTPIPRSYTKPNIQQPSDDDEDEEQQQQNNLSKGKGKQLVSSLKNTSGRNLHDKQQQLRHSDSEDSHDDEDYEEEDDDDESDHEDRVIQQQQTLPMARRPSSTLLDSDALNARRMSTLRQLERGPSMHKRSRSQGDLNLMAEQQAEAQVAAVIMEQQQQQQQQPYTEAVGGKSGVIERWRQGVTEGTPNSSRPTSAQGSSSSGASPASGGIGGSEEMNMMMNHDQRASFIPPVGYRRERRSTIGEMDMMYYQTQQQQQQVQWQMQQAAQLQQMQQMQQIQQYQQAAIMMQQQQQQQQSMMGTPMSMGMVTANTPLPVQQVPANQNPNRKSVSAMDLLTQMEKEKEEAKHKPFNPKTRVTAPNGAKIDSGLLGRVPTNKKTHNLNFQQLQQQGGIDRNNKFAMRASRSDMNLSTMIPTSQSDMNLSTYDMMGPSISSSSSNLGNLQASRSDMNLSATLNYQQHNKQRRSKSPGPERGLRSSSALDISTMGNKKGGAGHNKWGNTDARRRSEMLQVTPSMSTPTGHRQSYMPPSSNNNNGYGQYLMPLNNGSGMIMQPSMSSGNRSAPMNNNSNRRSMAHWPTNGGYQ